MDVRDAVTSADKLRASLAAQSTAACAELTPFPIVDVSAASGLAVLRFEAQPAFRNHFVATRLLCALALLAFGCSSLPPNALQPSQPGVLQRDFMASHSTVTESEYVACDTPDENDTGISEIAIERTPCYGICSTYTLRLFSDGRVEYTGQSAVKHVGSRRGKLEEYFFTRLARAAVGIGFFDLQERYVCPVTDNPTVYVAVTRHGQRKIIEHYAPEWTGPQALTLFEEAIDAVQQHIEWTPD